MMCLNEIDPGILRQLWSSIERTQAPTLVALDDACLIERLLQEFGEERSLDRKETESVSCYLRSRLLLIREVGHARLAGTVLA